MKIFNFYGLLLIVGLLFSCRDKKELAKTNLLIATTNGDLYNLNLKTGKLQWQISDNGNNDELTFFTLKDSLILRSYADKRIVAIDKSTGKINWIFNDEVSPNHGEYGYNFSGVNHLLFSQYPIINNNYFIFGNSLGEYKAVDLKSRKVKWTHQIHQPIYSSPVIFNGKLVINASSYLGTIDVNNGKKINRADFEEPLFFEPIMNEGLLYVVDEEGNIFCLNQSLEIVWKYTADISVFVHENISVTQKDILYGDTALISVDKKDGKFNWRTELPKQNTKKDYVYTDKEGLQVNSSPKNNLLQSVNLMNNRITVNTPHYIAVIDADNGKILKKKYFANKETIGELKYYDGFFYYLCSDENLYKIDKNLEKETLVVKNIKFKTERNMDDTFMVLY